MNDLRSVLDRATDAIEAPGLRSVVIATARHRRTRRRGLGAGLVAGVAVVAVVVATQAVHPGERTAPPVGDPTSGLSVSPDASSLTELELAGSIQESDVQAEWDPDDVLALPLREDLVAGETLSPPSSAVSLDDSPLEAAVALVDTGTGLLLSDVAGQWRSVAYPGDRSDGYAVALSTAGSRLVVVLGSGVWWRDLADREWNLIDSPPTVDLATETAALFLDDDVLAIAGTDGTWSVDLRSVGTGWHRLPFTLTSTGVAPDGTVVELRTEQLQGASRFVDEWSGAEIMRTTGADSLEYLDHPVVSDTSILATREPSSYRYPRTGRDLDGLVALERDGLTVRAYLPVPGDRAYYARAGLRPLAWLDDDTVLVRVVPESEEAGGTSRLVTWNVSTGDLSRTGASLPSGAVLHVATDLLGRAS